MNNLFNQEGILIEEALKEPLEAYFYSTGIGIHTIDQDGKIITQYGEQASFCKFFQDYMGKSCPCTNAHLNASQRAIEFGETYVFNCPAGLIHFTVPLLYKRQFKGALLAGPFLMEYPGEILVDEIMKKFDIYIHIKGKVFTYLKFLPVVEPSKVRHFGRILFSVASEFMQEYKHILYENRRKMHQQARINESIQFYKENHHISSYYPYEKEKDLLLKVKTGNVTGAKEILNELLGYVFFTEGGNLEIIKARTLELCSLLSRAAVEGGAALDQILGLNYNFIQELSDIHTIEDLSFWILKVLDRFTESILNLPDSKNAEVIKKAIQYIHEHYSEHLSLDSIAYYVHLNPSYFSGLFKKEMGLSLSDYINKVRIEQSKYLLDHTDNSILDIALMVGYEDQSYFSKVFKRITGFTPKQYKNKEL